MYLVILLSAMIFVVCPATVVDNPATTAAKPPVADKSAILLKPRIPAIIPSATALLSALLLALFAVDCALSPACFASIILWFNTDGGVKLIRTPKITTDEPWLSIWSLQ